MLLLGIPGEATTTLPDTETERGRSFTQLILAALCPLLCSARE